ncbi:MAG: cupredoxin domain-containing protein [Candidatus Saccharibacteria bacterium]
MKAKILILILGLAVTAAACNKQTASNSSTGSESTSTPANPDQGQPGGSSSASAGQSVIQMTDNGFTPSTITVKQGTTVVFQNTGTAGHWPASNPHPVHTDYPGFDAKKVVQPGDSYSFTFDRIGTWGFHDHTNPSSGGTIVVTP